MRIPAGVGSDLPENRKMSKEQGFLGTSNQPRVSRLLSHILTAYDDGQQVNIPVLSCFVMFLNCFRIDEASRGVAEEKWLDCNDKNSTNLCEFVESKSQ